MKFITFGIEDTTLLIAERICAAILMVLGSGRTVKIGSTIPSSINSDILQNQSLNVSLQSIILSIGNASSISSPASSLINPIASAKFVSKGTMFLAILAIELIIAVAPEMLTFFISSFTGVTIPSFINSAIDLNHFLKGFIASKIFFISAS